MLAVMPREKRVLVAGCGKMIPASKKLLAGMNNCLGILFNGRDDNFPVPPLFQFPFPPLARAGFYISRMAL